MSIRAIIAILATLAALAGCTEEDRKIRVGAKNFGESKILAHMMAAVIAEQGIPVEGVVEYENTPAIEFYWRRGGRPFAQTYDRMGGARLEKIGFSWA